MRNTTRTGAAALALLCSVAFAATGASAQTSSPMPNAGATASGAAQGIDATSGQTQAFLKSLENFVTQSVPGLEPSVGASVPQSVKLHPMPPQAQAALPQAKDHHIAKTDDQTILIVDPVTRQVVGVISADDDDDDDDGATAPGAAPKPGSGSNK